MTDLNVETLEVRLGGRDVVRNVSFAAACGELIAIVGANSVGKSTLMRAIAGLVPYTGAVRWRGQPVSGMTPAVRATTLAYMPQGQTFHWDIAVRHVVALGRLPYLGPMSRMSDADIHAVEDAMRRADVVSLADRTVMTLSGGERSRVLLARALAMEAPVLLADEPTAALDPYHQLHTMELLRDMARAGKCVIAVLHDLALAARFCDRVIVLHEGRILADAPPATALTSTHLGAAYGVEVYRAQVGDDLALLPWRRL